MTIHNQNSEDVVFDPKEFVEDFTLRYQDSMTESMIYDLFVVVKEAYGDGFIHGFNLGVEDSQPVDHLEWYEQQDADEEWIEEMSMKQLELLQEYEQYLDLPPGSPFDRKGGKDD